MNNQPPFTPDYPFGAAPAIGSVTEPVTGITWFRLPLPFALNHINCWIFGAANDCAIIDAGHYDEATKSIWQPQIARRKINQIVITHYHPDHLGCGEWLQSLTGAAAYMSREEHRIAAETRDMSDELEAQHRLKFFALHGLSGKALAEQQHFSFGYAMSVPHLPREPHWLVDGDTIPLGGADWRVLSGGGHSNDQTMLYESRRRILLAADQVLPSISPNISVWFDAPDADPLAEFFKSLARLRAEIPADALVLPSHGRPFYGLHGRIDQLVAHHQDRLELLLRLMTAPVTAAESLTPLFERELDDFQISFAMGEALAHLNHLVTLGLAERQELNGVMRFAKSSR
ncbi:MAG: MBL fold metallo-hydrolase [Candidatus Pacebacteria bacterium]|nr:MBL fold metallo-hydrolase [Candidatus Paceibacterota bacterium]